MKIYIEIYIVIQFDLGEEEKEFSPEEKQFFLEKSCGINHFCTRIDVDEDVNNESTDDDDDYLDDNDDDDDEDIDLTQINISAKVGGKGPPPPDSGSRILIKPVSFGPPPRGFVDLHSLSSTGSGGYDDVESSSSTPQPTSLISDRISTKSGSGDEDDDGSPSSIIDDVGKDHSSVIEDSLLSENGDDGSGGSSISGSDGSSDNMDYSDWSDPHSYHNQNISRAFSRRLTADDYKPRVLNDPVLRKNCYIPFDLGLFLSRFCFLYIYFIGLFLAKADKNLIHCIDSIWVWNCDDGLNKFSGQLGCALSGVRGNKYEILDFRFLNKLTYWIDLLNFSDMDSDIAQIGISSDFDVLRVFKTYARLRLSGFKDIFYSKYFKDDSDPHYYDRYKFIEVKEVRVKPFYEYLKKLVINEIKDTNDFYVLSRIFKMVSNQLSYERMWG